MSTLQPAAPPVPAGPTTWAALSVTAGGALGALAAAIAGKDVIAAIAAVSSLSSLIPIVISRGRQSVALIEAAARPRLGEPIQGRIARVASFAGALADDLELEAAAAADEEGPADV